MLGVGTAVSQHEHHVKRVRTITQHVNGRANFIQRMILNI